MSVKSVMPREELALPREQKSHVFVPGPPYMMSLGPIPLDAPRANAYLYLPNAHISGGYERVKKGRDIVAKGGFLRAEYVIGIL